MVLIEFTTSFAQRLEALREQAARGDQLAKRQLAHAVALLKALRDLAGKPDEESATFKQVRQARRHELWRVAHPYQADVAFRLIVWFPPGGTVVVTVFSFDKAKLGDVWYDRAAVEGQSEVDRWLREHPKGSDDGRH